MPVQKIKRLPLVLLCASQYSELTGNIGNIALLHLAGQLGLINAALAGNVADAYRDMRKWQHQLRLQGQDQSRVPMEKAATHAANVRQLWDSIF